MPVHIPLVYIMHLPVVQTVQPPATSSHVFSSVLGDHTVQQDMQMVCALLHSDDCYDGAMHERIIDSLPHKPKAVAAATAQSTQVVTGVPAVVVLQPQCQAVT